MARAAATLVGAVALAIVTSTAAGAGPDGAALYFAQCASCHGLGAGGDGPDANLFLPPPRSLREGFLERRETSELLGMILDGARRPLVLDSKALRARLKDTDALVAHLHTIPDVNWRLVERGQDLYLERCRGCHGLFGRPPWDDSGKPAPPDLSARAFQQSMSDDQLVHAIRHGRPGMPAIPTLRSDADASALLAFVRVLSPGFELYSRHCATCHGDDGHPQGQFVAPRQRPTVVFDRAWLARRDATQLRAAVSHRSSDSSAASNERGRPAALARLRPVEVDAAGRTRPSRVGERIQRRRRS
jgi:mono/diheme cytochrome c family protein